ncbi:TRAPP II complex [Schizophyllum commune]
MDVHAFASLAQVRILLVPVGNITPQAFESYAAEIRSFEQIRLGDISADSKDERARFMPNPLSTGHLHLSFPTHPPPSSHTPLSLLRPSHFPLAVIGIATCWRTDTLNSIRAKFNAALLDIFPAGDMYPLARSCFVFEESDTNTNLDHGDDISLVVIPSMLGNKKLYIGTKLADLCSHILGEFGTLVQTLESPQGNEYLNASLMPVLPPLSEIPASLDKGMPDLPMRDSLPPLPTHNSQPDISRSFTLSPAPNMKRTSSIPSRQSTLGLPTQSKKRSSGIGVASSPGRLFKVFGDFFLLAGRTADADIWYNEALQVFKTSPDPPWQASALEGLATIAVVDAWSAGQGLQTSMHTTSTKVPWADTADKLSQAIALYNKPPTFDADEYLPLLSYLYTRAVLRHTSLLFSLWSAKGWGPLAFSAMLHPGPAPYIPPTLAHADAASVQHLERLSLLSGISRATISSTLAQVHGPWLLHLGARERIAVLETTASIYGSIGYKRKQAYILREVLGCILDLLVCGREEDAAPAVNGLHSALPSIDTNGDGGLRKSSRGDVGVRQSESAEGNAGVLRVLKHVCRVFGIDLEAVKILEGADPRASQVAQKGAAPTIGEIDQDALSAYQEPYGWPELQVGVLREAVAVAKALPDYPAVAQFSLSCLKTLQNILDPGDQYYLYNTSASALVTAQRRGEHKVVEYWSGRPALSITPVQLPLMKMPLEKPISALQLRASDVAPILTGATDPFLYNPRRATAQGRTLIVQHEAVEFILILHNPFVFDLELQSVSLSTSGVPFISQSSRAVIPASSYHRLVLSGKAAEPGMLTVRGCIVQAPGGAPCEFVIPVPSEESEERISRKKSALTCESGRAKHPGLGSQPWARPPIRTRAETKSARNSSPVQLLEFKVVPELPLMRIRRTSVMHGALMLYEGERSVIRLTLENVSHLPVDFIRLAFDDSTIAPAQQALSEGELSVFDTYETEYDLLHRPLFSWNKDDAQNVAPGQKTTLNIVSYGKVGCTEGTIHISYAYVFRGKGKGGGEDGEGEGGEGESPTPDVFHTRQLSYPVLVTVYQMLQVSAMDVLPFPAYVPPPGAYGRQARANVVIDDESGDGWCLFSVEVRNSYGQPFEVYFDRVQEGAPAATSSVTISPGSTSRIVLPIKRLLLPADLLSQPIPTLSDRQFVVSKEKLPAEQDRLQRELFWYREELFKCICGRWRESGGTRDGELSLRQQRLTMSALDVLRLEETDIDLSLYMHDDDGEEHVVPKRAGIFYPPANEFVNLRCRVRNLTGKPISCTLDLGLPPTEDFIHDGVTNGIPIGELAPGEDGEVDVGVCFLAHGRFEITAQAKVFAGDDLRPSMKRLTALVKGS